MKHIDLMRLHDGELTADEAAELEAGLSDQDRAVLDGLSDLGERVRLMSSHPSIDLADQIMAALDETPKPAAEVSQLRPRRARLVIGGALGLAAAAAMVLWLTSNKSPAPTAQQPPVVAPVQKAPEAPVEAVAELTLPEDEEAPASAAIEAIDFGNRDGTIFMVPAGDETTPVVWLVDEADGRMEPL